MGGADAYGLCLEDFCVGEAAALAAWCASNPACAAGVMAVAAGGVYSFGAKKGTVRDVSAAKTVSQLCPNCNASDTRSQAQAKAFAFAGITPGSPGNTPTPWSNFNPPGGRAFKLTQPWADFFIQYYPTYFGLQAASGSIEEHPFGHPDLPGGQNHDCPHFVATNAAGQSMEFPYRPGS